MAPNITITGNLTDIAAGNDTVAGVQFRLVNYQPGPPRVAGASILSDVVLKPTISGTGTFSQALYANDQINPGASNTPPQTFYEFSVFNDQGATVAAASYQFTGSGSFDISNLVPLQNPFIAGPAGANSVLPVVFVPIAHQFLTGMNISGIFSSAQPAAADLSDGTTGSGNVVLKTSPTLVTPVLGAATYTTLSGGAITATGSNTIGGVGLASNAISMPDSAALSESALTGRSTGNFTLQPATNTTTTGNDLILSAGTTSNFGSVGGAVNISGGLGSTALNGQVIIKGGAGNTGSGIGIILDGTNSGGGVVLGESIDLRWLGTSVLKTSSATTVTMAGKFDTYNGLTTTGNGMPSEVAVFNYTAQTAAITTTILYAVTVAGQYDINWNAKITTAATTGAATSTLGALTVVYTDPDGVAITITAPASISAGTIATTSAGNTTSTVLLGLPLLLNCKASTNVTIAFAYASNTANQMAYNLHGVLKSL